MEGIPGDEAGQRGTIATPRPAQKKTGPHKAARVNSHSKYQTPDIRWKRGQRVSTIFFVVIDEPADNR